VPVFAGVLKQGWGWLLVIAVCSAAGAGCALAIPWALGRTIDAIVTGADSHHLVLLTAGLIVLAVAGDLIASFAGTLCVAGTAAWLRHRVIRHLLAISPVSFRRFAAGDLVTRISGNPADAAQGGTSLVAAAVSALPSIGSLVLLALIDPWMALALLAGLALVALLLRAFASNTESVSAAYQRVQGEIAGRLTESMGGIRTIAAASTVEQEEARVLTPLPSLAEQGLRVWHVLARSSAQAAVVGPLILVAVLAVGGVALTRHRISPGELFAAGRYASMGAGLGALTGVLGVFARARAAVRRVAEVLDLPPVRYGRSTLAPDVDGRLEFRAVSVDGLLERVDLVVPAGVCVAVVGRSGVGKSVLGELAARLREPDTGQILLGGVPLGDLSRYELRRAIGCAFERPVLCGATVGEAVGLGRPAAQVRTAARAVAADEFIARLPLGYDTPLTQAPMSGGERQRLGLARAWYAAKLLVLDDAMSNVDMVTEMKIGQALLLDGLNRTRLIITHRIPTAARADLVVWLDDGRIRAVATHGELWDDPDYRAVLQ
jgi:ATP-binding cassette subfamily B protein